jgi:hypothetical protein
LPDGGRFPGPGGLGRGLQSGPHGRAASTTGTAGELQPLQCDVQG